MEKVKLFGLANAPAFMRHMRHALKNAKYCAIYLDDILIHSLTPMEHKQPYWLPFEKHI